MAKITQGIERITPRQAQKWLNENNSGNRALREGVAEQYAADMKADKWTQCVDPIVFYEDGELADGQHRLFALIESDTAQDFIVVRGLDRASGLNIDTGLGRSVVDNGRISGLDDGLSVALVSAARACSYGMAAAGVRTSNADKLEMVKEHREACEWAIANGGKTKNISNSILHGALARAWYWEKDRERLAEFGHVICTGMANGDADSAAVSMRTYLMLHRSKVTNSSMWRDTFLKMMNAISYFMQRKRLTVIKGVKEEAYPLKVKRLAKKAA